MQAQAKTTALVSSLPSASQINHKSRLIAKAGKQWTQDVHEHAMLIARHIDAHGDVSIATVFCDLLPQGIKSNALRDWFLLHGGCNWNDTKKAFSRKKGYVFQEVTANAEPWYKLAKEPEFRPVDSLKLLQAALKKMRDAQDDADNAGKHKVDPRHIKALEAMVELN